MIGRFWLRGAVTALVMAVAPTAAAQDKGEEICVTVAHLWTGTSADVARIATAPVPDSFKRRFEEGGCGRFQLVLSSLTEWNLAFGSEASTSTALDYLAADLVPGRDYIADLGKQVAMARRAAESDPGTTSRPSKAALRFDELVWRVRNYVKLAELYLRAAEFYGSTSLLAGAERYAKPALDVQRLRVLSTVSGVSTRQDAILERSEVYDGQADALEMHLAVVRAALIRTDREVDAADAVMKTKERPFYRQSAQEAYTHGDDFCDIGDRDDLADYRKACDSDNFEWKAMAWLGMRARLDILKLSLSDDAGAAKSLRWQNIASTLFRIFAIKRAGQGEPRAMERYSGAENEITLRLARADALIRLAAKAVGNNNDGWGRAGILSMAMEEMIAAEPLAAPSDTPGRFRQIATVFLDAYGKAVALETARPGATDLNYPLIDRKAAYFRTMLPLVKAIGEGRSTN